jgi:hypothetical protein
VPADADVLGVIVDRCAQDRVSRLVMRRPGAHFERLAAGFAHRDQPFRVIMTGRSGSS